MLAPGAPYITTRFGGGQERGRRPGTENAPAIVGFGVAVEWALREEDEARRLAALRDRFEAGLPGDAVVFGAGAKRLPNTSNFAFDPDFTQETGTQAATFNVVLGTKQADEASVAMSVFPNPSNSQATVTYRVLNGSEYVNVVLTDLMGRTVSTLQDGKQAAGFQNIRLNSSTIAAGTYMVRVQVGDKVATRKVVLL